MVSHSCRAGVQHSMICWHGTGVLSTAPRSGNCIQQSRGHNVAAIPPACAGLAGAAIAAPAPQSGIRRRSRTGSLSDAMNCTTGVLRQLTEQRSALADQNRQGRKLQLPAVTKSGAPMIQIMAPVVVLIRRGWLKSHWCFDQQGALEPVLSTALSAGRDKGAGSGRRDSARQAAVPENPIGAQGRRMQAENRAAE